MRKLALILALAALLVPGLSLAETSKEPAPQTPDLSLAEILFGDACPTKASSVLSPPGCAKPCKSNLNCPYYPDQVCLNGCCVF
jgi:hypothetical protein